MSRNVLGVFKEFQALVDDLVIALARLEQLEIAFEVISGEGVVDRQVFQPVLEGLDRVIRPSGDCMQEVGVKQLSLCIARVAAHGYLGEPHRIRHLAGFLRRHGLFREKVGELVEVVLADFDRFFGLIFEFGQGQANELQEGLILDQVGFDIGLTGIT